MQIPERTHNEDKKEKEKILKIKKMKLLTNKQQISHWHAKFCYILKKKKDKHAKDQNYCNVRDYCHYTGEYRDAAHRICNLKYNVPKEVPMVFRNGSHYDYHFIIKELVREFQG